METASGGGTGAGNISGILWYLRFDQYDVQHMRPLLALAVPIVVQTGKNFNCKMVETLQKLHKSLKITVLFSVLWMFFRFGSLFFAFFRQSAEYKRGILAETLRKFLTFPLNPPYNRKIVQKTFLFLETTTPFVGDVL